MQWLMLQTLPPQMKEQRTSTYLWVMAQIMTSFSANRFRGHPSVAPVVMLHIFQSRVTVTAHD
jgi:hypothetical protein